MQSKSNDNKILMDHFDSCEFSLSSAFTWTSVTAKCNLTSLLSFTLSHICTIVTGRDPPGRGFQIIISSDLQHDDAQVRHCSNL